MGVEGTGTRTIGAGVKPGGSTPQTRASPSGDSKPAEDLDIAFSAVSDFLVKAGLTDAARTLKTRRSSRAIQAAVEDLKSSMAGPACERKRESTIQHDESSPDFQLNAVTASLNKLANSKRAFPAHELNKFTKQLVLSAMSHGTISNTVATTPPPSKGQRARPSPAVLSPQDGKLLNSSVVGGIAEGVKPPEKATPDASPASPLLPMAEYLFDEIPTPAGLSKIPTERSAHYNVNEQSHITSDDPPEQYKDDDDPGYRNRDLWECELATELALRQLRDVRTREIPYFPAYHPPGYSSSSGYSLPRSRHGSQGRTGSSHSVSSGAFAAILDNEADVVGPASVSRQSSTQEISSHSRNTPNVTMEAKDDELFTAVTANEGDSVSVHSASYPPIPSSPPASAERVNVNSPTFGVSSNVPNITHINEPMRNFQNVEDIHSPVFGSPGSPIVTSALDDELASAAIVEDTAQRVSQSPPTLENIDATHHTEQDAVDGRSGDPGRKCDDKSKFSDGGETPSNAIISRDQEIWEATYSRGSISTHRRKQAEAKRHVGRVVYPESGDPAHFPLAITKDKVFDCFNLKVIFDRDRTGFEEHKELQVIVDSLIAGRYRVESVLGQAAFSRALQCFDTVLNRRVCMKVIKNDKDYVDQSLDEIKLLRFINANVDNMDDVHCLKLYDFFYHKEHLVIVTELLKDNLYEFAKKIRERGDPPYFTIGRVQRVAWQVLRAFDYIHSLRLIHCDLKPENILIRDEATCEVKVIDFGSSCFEDDQLSTYVQSRSYRSPEVLLGLPYDRKIDMWSLGCILAELWTGYVLFLNESMHSMLARIVGIIGEIPYYMVKTRNLQQIFTHDGQLFQDLSNEAVCKERGPKMRVLIPKKSSLKQRMRTNDKRFLDFLHSLLQIDPAKRPTAREALQHPWMQTGLYVDGL